METRRKWSRGRNKLRAAAAFAGSMGGLKTVAEEEENREEEKSKEVWPLHRMQIRILT